MRSEENVLKVLPALCIGAGMCLMLYPWVSESLYENRADSVIRTYEAQAEELGEGEKQEMLQLARGYNEWLSQTRVTLTDPFIPIEKSEGEPDYYDILSFDSSGYMGAIEIPVISVNLPLYHGTDAAVLEHGIGHLETSSFPVGGADTHAVLAGHTGLNSAKMFTDLVELEKGDLFFIHILDETLTYEVNEISVAEPSDTGGLAIRPGKDLVTLVTCTPYGVNSHRLLVTGERTEYTTGLYEDEKKAEEESIEESLWMKSYKKAVLTGIGAVVPTFIGASLCLRLKNRKRRELMIHRRKRE